MEQKINELVGLLRIIGNLYYRHPTDKQLTGLYDLILHGKLESIWPLKQTELLTRMSKAVLNDIAKEFDNLFGAENGILSLELSTLTSKDMAFITHDELSEIITTVNMPIADANRVYQYGFLWLLLAWIESQLFELRDELDNLTEQSNEALLSSKLDDYEALCEAVYLKGLLPASKALLGKIEAHTQIDFFKAFAILTREVVDEVGIALAEQDDGESTKE